MNPLNRRPDGATSMTDRSLVVPIGRVIIRFSVAVSSIVRFTVFCPFTFLDIVGFLTVTVAVDVAIRLFTAPAGCVGSPVLLPLLDPGDPGVALFVP